MPMGTRLLTIKPSGATTIVQDVPGQRSVQYTFGVDPNAPGTRELLTVSQIAPQGGPFTTQYAYHYAPQSGIGTLLQSVFTPQPGNPARMISNQIIYFDGGQVQMLKDANSNTRNYQYNDDSTTTVTIPDSSNTNPAETWTEKFFGSLTTGDTDANGNSDTIIYNDATAFALPTKFTNKNAQTTTIGYEYANNVTNYGNISHGFDASYLYSVLRCEYALRNFWHHEDGNEIRLQHLADGAACGDRPVCARWRLADARHYHLFRQWAKQRASVDDFKRRSQEPRRNWGVRTPMVTTTYAYTPLGNVASIMEPGPNNTNKSVVYMFKYTDATGKIEALGEPTSITDPAAAYHPVYLRRAGPRRLDDRSQQLHDTIQVR